MFVPLRVATNIQNRGKTFVILWEIIADDIPKYFKFSYTNISRYCCRCAPYLKVCSCFSLSTVRTLVGFPSAAAVVRARPLLWDPDSLPESVERDMIITECYGTYNTYI